MNEMFKNKLNIKKIIDKQKQIIDSTFNNLETSIFNEILYLNNSKLNNDICEIDFFDIKNILISHQNDKTQFINQRVLIDINDRYFPVFNMTRLPDISVFITNVIRDNLIDYISNFFKIESYFFNFRDPIIILLSEVKNTLSDQQINNIDKEIDEFVDDEEDVENKENNLDTENDQNKGDYQDEEEEEEEDDAVNDEENDEENDEDKDDEIKLNKDVKNFFKNPLNSLLMKLLNTEYVHYSGINGQIYLIMFLEDMPNPFKFKNNNFKPKDFYKAYDTIIYCKNIEIELINIEEKAVLLLPISILNENGKSTMQKNKHPNEYLLNIDNDENDKNKESNDNT